MRDATDPILEAYFGPFAVPGAAKCTPLSLSRRQAWGIAGVEPALCDLLADPLVRLVMRRDGVSEDALKAVVRQAQAALGVGLCPCLAA